MQFVDGFSLYQVFVLHDKRLVTPAVLLIHFHHQLLAVGDGELLQAEHRAL